MKKNTPANQIATVAIFVATMLVVHVISQSLFSVLSFLPIKPTVTHIPVIVASIIYGPRIGATMGTFMGILSLTQATILQSPASYLFSPFVENGNFNSFIIALVPRILIGIVPYFVYKFVKNRFGLLLAGAVGSMTNTVFVLGGIFFLFSSVYNGDVTALLGAVFANNAIAEAIVSAILTMAIVPPLEKLKK